MLQAAWVCFLSERRARLPAQKAARGPHQAWTPALALVRGQPGARREPQPAEPRSSQVPLTTGESETHPEPTASARKEVEIRNASQ